MAAISDETNGLTLTPKQARAIVALLTARNLEAAAREAGVGERTLSTWLTDPVFKAALKQAEAEAIEAAGRRLAGYSEHAVSTVLTLMADRNSPPSVRLKAAATILDQLLKWRQYNELEERIAALEAAALEKNG
jgi:hypothetical protein